MGPPPPKISLSYGLNIPNKKGVQSTSNLAAGQKRKKNIFDDDDDDNGDGNDNGNDTGRITPVSLKGSGNAIKKSFGFGGLRKEKGLGGFGYDDAEGDKDEEDSKGKEVEITVLGGLEDDDEKKTQFTSKDPPSLKATSKPSSKLKLKPSKPSPLFTDDDNYGDNDNRSNQNDPPARKHDTKSKKNPDSQEYTNLAALHTSSKHAREAESIDPSIYSYDSVYDSIKAQREKPLGLGAAEAAGQPSRYMDSLLRSAEVRKRDQIRARDRLLAREREAEGEEFADKEQFVTGAYRAQQEEIRKMEEEEARKEKEEEERRRRNGGSGLTSFYRDMLARGEDQHSAAVKAAEEAAAAATAAAPNSETETEEKKEKSEAEIAAELNARGANIVVNDEGQIVDKRQLLSAGLNVAPKPKTTAPSAAYASKSSASQYNRPDGGRFDAGRNAQRHRQTEMIAAQLEERARQEEEAEAARRKELAEKNKSRKTEKDVSSARERFLARKKEREEAAKEKTEGR